MKFILKLHNDFKSQLIEFTGLRAEEKAEELFNYFSDSQNGEWPISGEVLLWKCPFEYQVIRLFELKEREEQ